MQWEGATWHNEAAPSEVPHHARIYKSWQSLNGQETPEKSNGAKPAIAIPTGVTGKSFAALISTRCRVLLYSRDDWSYEIIPRLGCPEPVPFISPTTIDMRYV